MRLDRKRWDTILSAFFTMVGVVVVVDVIMLTVSFNRYVRDTVARDTAQEQCITDTITALKKWSLVRRQGEDAELRLDNTFVRVLGELHEQNTLTMTQRDELTAAIEKRAAARADVIQILRNSPLPTCDLGVN